MCLDSIGDDGPLIVHVFRDGAELRLIGIGADVAGVPLRDGAHGVTIELRPERYGLCLARRWLGPVNVSPERVVKKCHGYPLWLAIAPLAISGSGLSGGEVRSGIFAIRASWTPTVMAVSRSDHRRSIPRATLLPMFIMAMSEPVTVGTVSCGVLIASPLCVSEHSSPWKGG